MFKILVPMSTVPCTKQSLKGLFSHSFIPQIKGNVDYKSHEVQLWREVWKIKNFVIRRKIFFLTTLNICRKKIIR